MSDLTKKNLKSICRGIAFVLLFLAAFYYLSVVFSPKIDDGVDGFSSNMEYSYRGEPKDTIDIMFVGNSDVGRGVNPSQIWRDYKIAAVAVGSNVAGADTVYTKIQEVLELHHPKLVAVDVDCLFSAGNKYYDLVTNDAQKGKVVKENSSLKNILDNVNDETISGLSFYWPLMKHHYRWNELKFSDFVSFSPTYKYSSKGYMYTTESIPFRFGDEYMNEKTDKCARFRNETNENFDKIVDLCNQNDIQLTLVAIPSGSSWSVPKYNACVKLAKKHNLDFVDYNVNPELMHDFNWQTDTKDAGNHLNYSGATKFTAAYMDHLVKIFDIKPSELTDDQIDILNEDADRFYNKIVKQ